MLENRQAVTRLLSSVMAFMTSRGSLRGGAAALGAGVGKFIFTKSEIPIWDTSAKKTISNMDMSISGVMAASSLAGPRANTLFMWMTPHDWRVDRWLSCRAHEAWQID